MRSFVCIVIVVALAGPMSARASDLSPKETKAAQDLYDNKCAKCHKFYNPAEYSQEEWDMWMRKMAKKAKLKPAQNALLSKYLQTFRDTTSATNKAASK